MIPTNASSNHDTLSLSTVEVSPSQPADSTIIWLHGLGASGHDFEGIVPMLGLPASLHTHFIFPNAPIQPVTINQGMEMPSWYDIRTISTERDCNLEDLRRSAGAIQSIIDSAIDQGIPGERILLFGFSQGGAVALEAGLTYSQRLGGLLCLSSYFATQSCIQQNVANQMLPIEVHHGTQDPVVPELLGKQAAKALSEMGYATTYRAYSMPHSVCPEQVADISQFIQKSLLYTRSE